MNGLPCVAVYCDGACKGNPGPGGWAFLLRHCGPGQVNEREGAGGEPETTNNRMELMAAIMALETLARPCAVDLFADSQYVVKGIRDWLPGWKRAGWRKADRQPVLNVDLWQRLDRQLGIHQVVPHWVRGHAGHAENERVDRLAAQAAHDAGGAPKGPAGRGF